MLPRLAADHIAAAQHGAILGTVMYHSTISLTIYQLSGLAAAAQPDRGTARLILVLIPEKLSATDSLKIWNRTKMFLGAGQSEVNKRLFPSDSWTRARKLRYSRMI